MNKEEKMIIALLSTKARIATLQASASMKKMRKKGKSKRKEKERLS